MRLSANEHDPSYKLWQNVNCFNHVTVLLDGVEQRHCKEADEEAGYVICYEEDDEGRLKTKGGYIVHVKREGVVRIVLTRRQEFQ